MNGSVGRLVDRGIWMCERSTGAATKGSFSFKNQAKRPSQLGILDVEAFIGQRCEMLAVC